MAKVMISLPADLLRLVDSEGARRATTTSAFLAAAATRELERRDPATLKAAVARSTARFAAAAAFDAADVVRADREARR